MKSIKRPTHLTRKKPELYYFALTKQKGIGKKEEILRSLEWTQKRNC